MTNLKGFGCHVIVFDEYIENSTAIKAVEWRYTNKNLCPDINFYETMNVTASQDKFLSDCNSKSSLILFLSNSLEK